MDCLICLAPCDADGLIRCRNAHAMHKSCFQEMVLHMAKTNCPYCSAHVPAIRTIQFPPPGPIKSAFITLEHWFFMLVLIPNYLLHYRVAWAINSKLMYIRLKFNNVSPLKQEIREFRRTMTRRILSVMPTILLCLELATRTAPFTRTDALRLVLTMGHWLH